METLKGKSSLVSINRPINMKYFRIFSCSDQDFVLCEPTGDYVFSLADLISHFSNKNITGHIVQQWSGLSDVNDNLVFEGDRVKFDRQDSFIEYNTGEIVFSDGKFVIKTFKQNAELAKMLGCAHFPDGSWSIDMSRWPNLEVLGSIFENFD